MRYSQSVQKIISYVEENLCENIALDKITSVAGYSKYHLTRIFKQETGSTISEHIQSRRLAKAAKLLLYTEMNILDIAFMYQFESQEAFTRAFKKEYNLPPGRYRKAMSNLIYFKEVADMAKNDVIPGWIVTGTAPGEYSVRFDLDEFYEGTRSVCIKGDNEAIDDRDYMTVMQQFKAKNYIGKRVRFSAFIKTVNVSSWCGLWMRINNATSGIVRFDNMQDRPIKGDNDWNYYSVVLDIPESSNIINIGVLINGKGAVWMDNVKFEIVDRSVDTTDVDLSSELSDGPVNLSLEESETSCS